LGEELEYKKTREIVPLTTFSFCLPMHKILFCNLGNYPRSWRRKQLQRKRRSPSS